MLRGGLGTRTDPVDAAEALIQQARRRQYRRRAWIASTVMVLAVIITGTAVFGLASGSGPDDHRGPRGRLGAPAGRGVSLSRPEALAATRDGDLLIANDGTNQILRRGADGVLAVVAGTGQKGYGGDNGPAVDAKLDDPGGMAVAADGTIYIADSGNNRVRAISPDGRITTVAGNGRYGTTDAGRSARRTQVGDPRAVAIGPAGRLFITDGAGLQTVSANGLLSTIIRAGPGTVEIDHARAAFFPDAVAVSPTGDLYVADFSPKLLIEFSPALRVVHDWDVYVQPAGLATTTTGAIAVADYGRFAIDHIRAGRLVVAVRFHRGSRPGVGTFRPSGIAAPPNGRLYAVTDGVNGGTNRPALIQIRATAVTQLSA